MIIPVRCFSCGKVLADKWRAFEKAKAKSDAADKATESHPSFQGNYGADLDKLGLTKICCRRHMLGHVDMMSTI